VFEEELKATRKHGKQIIPKTPETTKPPVTETGKRNARIELKK